ncbi:ribosome biogenesis GTPase Der [Buchnera aphidicola (Macrosiphoniella sanborni)]|uniref:GTPase Der n=1 Tax=Buchnera aphidicola (Macrosiphoniella sanborni) TaxID=1241865 RepID=A0A4D6YI69_9GAMM|nr:ribosome biogenesis GTPase Der [Buchnera aphidicola]QCI24095.1 ribosome biogenesis GTPase Der [Buchnera aphidicola (Macrosiphoniella sanborni)]
MIPIIVLIGRTNVGKSTLFNILTKTKNALVANHKGLTKDRQYGYCTLLSNQKIILIDTAGLDIQFNEIEKQAYKQTLQAIEESNLILFVVDAHDGLMPQEYEIAEKIRKYHKKIILIINKIDGSNLTTKINEFYLLGFKNIQEISAIHNQGINILKKNYLIPWITQEYQQKNIKQDNLLQKSSIKIAFIGRPNVGKSTLINNILNTERMITCNIPGTTSDNISIPMKYKNKNYILIDTPGASKKKIKINNFEKFSLIKTLKTIEHSHVVLLIIDASLAICNQDLLLANFINNSGKGIIIIINKCDLLNSKEQNNIQELIKNQIKFIHFPKIHFISALYKKGIFQIFKSVYSSYKESTRKISTSKITQTMYEAIKKHQPPIIKGRRIKLKYAHVGNSNPLKIIIHGTQVKNLSLSYKKYLINFFQNALKIKNTPIQIQFKDNLNPYIYEKK